jgi:signal transduction histidine kinase
MLDVCIRVSGNIVGIVCCEKVGQAKRWAVEDISFAGELADQMALAINNRRWLDETALLRDAQASNQAKSHLLASISHEIRTPMNGVLGMVELLQATPLNESINNNYYRSLATQVSYC